MRLRSVIITLLVLLLLAGGVLTGFWYYASGELAKGIADWQRDWRADGGVAEFAAPKIGGLPLRLTADFVSPVVGLPSGETWRGPPLVKAKSWLWELLDFGTITFDAPGHHEFDLPQGRLALDATEVTGSITLSQGLLSHLTLQLTQAVLINRDTGQQLAPDALMVSLGPLHPVDGKDFAIDINLDLQGLPLPPDAAAGSALLGPRLERLRLVGTLKGPLAPQASPRAAAAYWRDGGGIVELTDIELQWGDLSVTGDGTLTLDEAFRPLGAFSFQTAGLLQVVERLEAEGLLDPQVAPGLKAALQALSTGKDPQGRDLVKLPLTAQDGTLYMGLVPLGELLPLF